MNTIPINQVIFRLTPEQYDKGTELAKELHMQSIGLLAKRLLLDKLEGEESVINLTDAVETLSKRLDALEREMKNKK